jgi:hypothetical protein
MKNIAQLSDLGFPLAKMGEKENNVGLKTPV